MLFEYSDMLLGVSKVVDISPMGASNNEKGWHTNVAIDAYISHTVHHDSGVQRTLNNSMIPWFFTVLYCCGRFGGVQLANEAKKQILLTAYLKSKTSVQEGSYQAVGLTDRKGRFSAYLLLISLCDLRPSIASSTFRRTTVFCLFWIMLKTSAGRPLRLSVNL